MKFGIRMPSLKRHISARTSWKRYVRHSIGLKAPRGMGILTNPKKALYNKVYNKTSVGVDKLIKGSTNHPSTLNINAKPQSIRKSTIFNIIIFLVLFITWYPIGIIFLIYKIYTHGKKIIPASNEGQTNLSTEKPDQKTLTPSYQSNSLISKFEIPEPTKSLLWITDEDTSKISSPIQIRIEIKVGRKDSQSNIVDDSYNFYSEPSLIWTKLPIQPNDELETQKMYYPTYSGLSPKNRYQYLKWLSNITQKTNLSYVFLYYYGLERHLLVGNYDLAVDEILRLIKYQDKGTVRGYAINALILASGYRKRADIIEKAPFILEGLSPISLYLQRMAGKPLSAKDVIYLASKVGFSNRRYIKQYPELFEKELQKILDDYQLKHGDILQSIDTDTVPRNGWASIANASIPESIRTVKFPSLLDSTLLKSILKERLQETHIKVRDAK